MIDELGRTTLRGAEAVARGMSLAAHAAVAPERLALASPAGDRSMDELNANANRLVRALRASGLEPGDGVALLCSNRPEFVEVMAAVLRSGLRLTPINWHLTGEEVGYIVHDCEAKAFVAEARFAAAATEAAARAPAAGLRLAVDGAIPGFAPYADALQDQAGEDLPDPELGGSMLYTSGTTGRPKGVYRKRQPRSALLELLVSSAGFRPEGDLALCTGPLYHAAPLALNLQLPLASGVGVVLMDEWDPRETLRLVEERRITHTHMVPTMFHRLLALPQEEGQRHDLASLRWVLHGAAPCPVHVKKRMIEWFGPVIYEYYAATEGGAFFIDSTEWLEKPGSVGRLDDRQHVEFHDDEGRHVDKGEVGTIYFKAPEVGRFEYFKAPSKTASAYRGDFFTMGDMGYLDEDDYLFLTGRSAELIISGGVNIYPAEVDAALLLHPAVADVGTIGVPNEEWGEEVLSVVQPEPGTAADAELARELIEHCRARLAHYKCPRRIEFSEDLPRMPTGKIQRGKLRERFVAAETP